VLNSKVHREVEHGFATDGEADAEKARAKEPVRADAEL